MADYGAELPHRVIVACGPASADPHYFGRESDELRTHQPIITDIYPRLIEERYYADMTRTVVRGGAEKKVKKMYQVVLEALEKSIDAIEVGMTGKEIFYLTCDVMESHGFDTKRGGKKIKRGFLHGTGHGVGLAVHEPPVLTETGREALEEHNVVAVEPGLYDPAIGGVRIEDLGVVRKGGFEKLTSAKRVLEV